MDLKDGGVVRALLDLCPALAAAGHEITMLCCRDKDIPETWRSGAAGVPRLVRLSMPGRFNLLGRDALAEAERALSGVDVLHVHGMWMPSNDQIAAAALRRGLPYVWSPHGMLDDWCMAQGAIKKRMYLRVRERSLLERAACVHCTAQAELDQARKWFPNGRGRVTPLLFDLQPFEALPGPDLARRTFGLPSPSDADHRPIVLFVSRLHPKKGVGVLLEAIARLNTPGGGPACTLVIAGEGEAEYVQGLQEQARRLGLGEHVKFVGFVAGELKTSLYQAADVFALPSSQENFGFVLVESLMCRTPVVTTRNVGIWPELETSGAAKIVAPEAGAFATAIAQMLGDEAGRRAMGERGREFVSRFLDPDRVLGELVEMYRGAVETRTSPVMAGQEA